MTMILRVSVLLLVFFLTPLFSLYAAVGETWIEATSSAEWTDRHSATSLVFDNKMWVLGGYTSDNVNDVWYSTDGVSWTQATSSAEWEGRRETQALVFDNKMWVLGGYTSDNVNDVWYSTDGVSWTQATSSAEWTDRRSAASVVFDNKMWVLGGTTGSGSVNDVWYSTDGVSWTQATASAGWTARMEMTALVFDNKMWVLGGFDGAKKRDVWYSTDGVSWTQATSSAEWGARSNHTSLVFDNKMWVLGGYTSDNVNDVWYSTDGVSWTQATSSAEWTDRERATSVVFDNKMWVLGGQASTRMNDVWYSTFLYDLSFDSQGGSSVSAQQNKASGASLVLPSTPTRSGYRFLNWNTSSGGSGTSYSAGASFSMPASHTTLYAIWQAQVGAAIPWCSGPMAPGWDSNKPDGGCGVVGLTLTSPPPTLTVVPTQQSTVQIFAMPVRDLRYGMTGADVKTLQEFLVARGYGISAGITGSFYRQTQAALANYQMDHGIKPAAGYYGSVTRAQIQALLAE